MVQYSDDMARVTVVCAHRGEVEDETMMRTQLHAEERLRWMGGTVVDEYSPEVTHVLASTVNDTVRQARADKKYVLKFGWVSDCWIKSTMLSSFAVATTARNHKLELLAGCSIFIDPVIWTDKGSLARKQFRTLGETSPTTSPTSSTPSVSLLKSAGFTPCGQSGSASALSTSNGSPRLRTRSR
jgi:hypothetical protein